MLDYIYIECVCMRGVRTCVIRIGVTVLSVSIFLCVYLWYVSLIVVLR